MRFQNVGKVAAAPALAGKPIPLSTRGSGQDSDGTLTVKGAGAGKSRNIVQHMDSCL
jgi:hypothetical protein